MADDVVSHHEHGVPAAVWAFLGSVRTTRLLLRFHRDVHARLPRMCSGEEYDRAEFDAGAVRVRWGWLDYHG